SRAQPSSPGRTLMTRGVPGVDAAWNKPPVSALKAAGEVFFAGYFSSDPTKNLTPALVHDLLAARIEIVAVWEYSATAMPGGTAAWSGNEWATSGLTPDIMQGGLVTVGGVQCDLDAGLSSDFGQWPRPRVVATWQALVTDGTFSLEQAAETCHMLPSSVLRH